MNQLKKELRTFETHCQKRALKPAVRLNGTSDIPWENVKFQNPSKSWSPLINLFQAFPRIQFYDYTKSKKRALSETLPQNYHLTFSRSEVTSNDDLWSVIKSRTSCAVVFKSFVPETFEGLPVIDGDQTDLRFLDPKGFVIGLSAKGQAKKDTTGFVVNN